MKITKTGRVSIASSGRSDFYGGALVSGAFVGRSYYSADDVARLLGVSVAQLPGVDLDSTPRGYEVSCQDLIEYRLKPTRTVGCLVV